mgnify:CR=1 FL=1
MDELLGEFECKLDGKGRLMFPAGLKRKLPEASATRFVLNRGFEQCLMLYPVDTWKKIRKEISRLNLYIKKNRDFVRYFYRGASEVELDGTNRLLIPKGLKKYAGIEKEVVVFAFVDRIEIWDREKYENLMNDEPEGYAELAELTMGDKEPNIPEDVS